MPTVLVVDDVALDRRLAGGLLEKSPNLEVAFAENGHQALEMIDQSPYDMVITDLQMPDLDGLQLVTEIVSRHPEIPVVLMTAHGSEVVAAQALANGAASYVPKQELANCLLETVTDILAMSYSDQRYQKLIECSTKTEFEFSLTNDLELIEPLIELVQQVIASMRLTDATGRIRVGVALENALRNAIIRGNLEVPRTESQLNAKLLKSRRSESPYADRRVYVRALLTRDEARFVIRDEGPGFNISDSPRPGDPDAFRDGSGRGLVLMRNFMDECEFNDRGNEVTMVKRRDPDPKSG